MKTELPRQAQRGIGQDRLRIPGLLGLLFAACAACTPTVMHPAAPSGPDALSQVGRWTLQGATDAQGQPIPAVRPGGVPRHAVVFNEGELAIQGGCNHMGGRYAIDGQGRLVVGDIRSTLMACADDALMAADAAVAGLLQGSSEWRIAESYPEQLFLERADGRRSSWVADRPALPE